LPSTSTRSSSSRFHCWLTAAAVGDLAATYAERRVAVITLIASRPMDNVRAFSDAFRLRKKED
jgi:hypothetical protein